MSESTAQQQSAAAGSTSEAPAAAHPDDTLVQYLLVRSDLDKQRYGRGALVAQGAHASVAALHESRDEPATQAYLADLGAMHKIVLAAPSAEAIEGVAAALRSASLGARVWVEQPEMVVTALATAPARRSVLAAFFQGLKLLR